MALLHNYQTEVHVSTKSACVSKVKFTMLNMNIMPLFLLAAQFSASEAFTAPGWLTSKNKTPSFVNPRNYRRDTMPMDIEIPNVLKDMKLTSQVSDFVRRWQSRRTIGPNSQNSRSQRQGAKSLHGMPWKTSIDPSYTRDELYYMPFWEWQVAFMEENLTNLKVVPALSKAGEDMSYKKSADGKMRIHTMCFQSDEYKNIRLTVLDAGPKTQVFTSLWYPDPKYNLPVLGTDLLQFNNAKKHLCVVDYQPIQESEELHAQSYEEALKPVRNLYPSLHNTMTKRFYDETQFFSSQMLLARDQEGVDFERTVFDDLMPAWQQYVRKHVELVKSTLPNMAQAPEVLDRHTAYDDYSAARDPAHGLLAKSFGQEWADAYVYDILFPLSTRPDTP